MSHAALANPTFDGLNLFAKEAAVLLDDHAPLLLSVNAGVFQQIGSYSVPLDPFDLDQMSSAMEAALDGDRSGPWSARRELLRHQSARSWLRAVFPDP